MTNINLPQDAHLFILDEEGIVYRAETQQLFSLNTFATFLWITLEQNVNREHCIEQAVRDFSITQSKATEYLDMALDSWRSLGLLGENRNPGIDVDPNLGIGKFTNTDKMPSRPHSQWERNFHISLIDCKIHIFLELAEYYPCIYPIIGHLELSDEGGSSIGKGNNTEPDSEQTIHVCQLGDGIGIYRNDSPVAIFFDISALGPTAKSIMMQIAIDANDSQFYFHAGLLSDGDKLLMLPGEQGAGKSTLTAGLMESGLEYFTDEVALFNPSDAEIRPFPIAICSKSSAWELLSSRFPQLALSPTYSRLDGKAVKYMTPSVDPFDPSYDRPLPVKYLIFPKYDAAFETELRAIRPNEALTRLFDQCLAIKKTLDVSSVALLIDWIRTVECYELPNNSLDASIEKIAELI